MSHIMALLCVIAGIGFLIDPRLAQYEWSSIVGVGLLIGALAFFDLQSRFPFEWPENLIANVTDKFDQKIVLLVLVAGAMALCAFFYFTDGFSKP